MKTTVTLICALLLFTSSLGDSHAAALRGSVTVNGEFVRVGDIFAGAGDAAGAIVAGAPAPGKSEVFTSQRLAAIAREHKLSWTPTTRYERSTVTRAGRPIDRVEIEQRLKAALAAEGLPEDYQLELAGRDLELFAADGPQPAFTLENPRLNLRAGQFAAVVAVSNGKTSVERVQVTGRVYAMVEVPVLARRMKRDEVIGRDDVMITEKRRETVDRNVVLDVSRIVGKTPRRYLRAGIPLRAGDLRLPVAVSKGSTVTLILRTDRMTLTAKGRALHDAAMGETLRVMNTRSKSTVEGIVDAPDRVTVTLPSAIR